MEHQHQRTKLDFILLTVLLSSSLSETIAVPIIQTNITQLDALARVPPMTEPLHNSYPTNFRSDIDRVTGVWPITKIVSLLGPTLAIFAYEKARRFYELYEPFISVAMIEFAQSVQHTSKSPYNAEPVVSLSSMPQSQTSPHVTRIANEIIRLTNIRLRERAVISRMQMDDDQYEFSKNMSSSEVRGTAMQVMRGVLTSGAGQYLKNEEKIAVHALISSSIY